MKFGLQLLVLGWALRLGVAHAGEGDAPRLGNESLELRFVRDSGGLRLGEIVNKLSGRSLPVQADDFLIEGEGRAPLRAADFRFVRDSLEAMPGGRRLRLLFDHPADGLTLEVIYELGDHDFFARRRLELATAKPLSVRQIEVWRAAVPATCRSQEEAPPFYLVGNVPKIEDKKGFGLPLLLDDTFWGLECPTGYNRYEQGAVILRHCPGQTVTNRFASKTAVVGVARPGELARQFRRYVETFQATPSEAVVIGFNTWTSLMPPTEKNCLAFIDLLRRKLYEPYGVRLDFFGLDDGWDDKNSLWDYRKDGFANGFDPLLAALNPMKTRLGLWMPPSSGYGHAAWCGQHGYARNPYWDCVCQSDPNYRRDMAKVATGYRQRYELGYFKLDGFMSSCDAGPHPWHLGGDFAREANVAAAEELFAALRNAAHPVYLEPTSGMWLSPWWLRTADTLWPDLYDGEAPAAMPAPNFRESSTTSRDAQFRLRCRQNPFFPPYAIGTLDIYQPNQPLGRNDVMATLARGQRLVNLYADLRRFSDDDWAFLAAGFNWVRDNAATLSRTEQIPGDPCRGEAYGLAHFRGRRGILSLRNPAAWPRKIRVRLDESSGWLPEEAEAEKKGGVFIADIVYPRHETLSAAVGYGGTLDLELQPYEQMVVHIEPEDGTLRLSGAPARETGRNGSRATWEVMGAAGETTAVFLRGTNGPVEIRLDGRVVKDAVKTRDGWRIPLAFGGTKAGGRLEGALPARWTGGAPLTGEIRATVPPGAKASVVILCRAETDRTSGLQCEAAVNQAKTAVRSFGPHLDPPHKLFYREIKRQYWKWFEFDLPAGTNDIALTIAGAPAGTAEQPITVQGALSVEEVLTGTSLSVDFAHPLPASAAHPLPMPIAQATRRTVVMAASRGEPAVEEVGTK